MPISGDLAFKVVNWSGSVTAARVVGAGLPSVRFPPLPLIRLKEISWLRSR